jgi:hypothetical protein
VLEFFQDRGIEGSAEGSDAAEHAGRMRGFDFLFEQLHRTVALVDVDPAVRVAAGRAGQLAPADVAAELAALEADLACRGIGAFAGLFHVASGRGDIEDATSGGDDGSVRLGGPRMVDKDIPVCGRSVESLDFVAGHGFGRITAGGQHDGARGFVTPADGQAVQTPLDAGQRDVTQVRLEQGEQCLGLGIAEAAVVFDQLGTVRRHHQPGVEHADIGCSFRGEAGDGWTDNGLEHLRHHGGRADCRRCVGTHAAGVGSAVPFADAFVVLRGRHDSDRLAVGKNQQRNLRSGQTLLEENGAVGGQSVDGLVTFLSALRHDHAFARGQAVGFDHHGKILRIGPSLRLVRGLRPGKRRVAR